MVPRILAVLSLLLVLLLTPGVPALADDVCDGQGNATLGIVAGTLPAPGAFFTMEVAGRPFAPVSVILDTGPGPVTVPRVGTFCLDLGPHKRVILDGIRNGMPLLPVSGAFQFSLEVPARASLIGRTFYAQAAVQDPEAPNGIAISNMVPIVIRPALLEDFSTTAARDDEATTALWEGDGRAVGVVLPPRISEYIANPQSNFHFPQPLIAVGDPLTPDGCRFQMKFDSDRVGAESGESIVGMSWGPRSNFLFASTYADMEVRLAHFSGEDGDELEYWFDSNYDPAFPENPVTVSMGDYEVPTDTDTPWFPWPEFSRPFDYVGTKPLVFEVLFPVGGDTFQLFYNSSTASTPRNRLFANFDDARSINGRENTTYNTRFVLQLLRTRAQSVFLDTGAQDPDFFPPRLATDILPPGTGVKVLVEGMLDADGDGLPDPGSETGFQEDIDAVDGHRFVRFRVVLHGDADSGEVPAATLLAIPFEPR